MRLNRGAGLLWTHPTPRFSGASLRFDDALERTSMLGDVGLELHTVLHSIGEPMKTPGRARP